MKFINILFLLLSILILSNAKQLTFDTNEAVNCITVMNPCFFDEPENWGNQTVSQGDSFLIDLTSLENFGYQKVYFRTRSALRSGNFTDLVVIGSSSVQASITFLNTTSLIFNNITITNGFLVFDNDGLSQAGNNIEILSAWSVKNTSIVGTDTNLVSEGILLDATSSMLFQTKSSVSINGLATFYGSVQFMDDSNFAVTDTIDGYLTFHQGINSDATVIIGKATIFGNSNFETLIVNGGINFSNATAIIGDTLKFVSTSESQGQFILDSGSTVTVAGTSEINIANVEINDYSTLVIANFNADITNCTGDGGVISYSIDIFNENNFSNNNITNLQSEAIDIKLTGKVDLWITNSIGGKIIEIPPATGDNPSKMIHFSGSSTFNSIISLNTNTTVNSLSILSLNGTGSGTISQLDVWGTANIQGESTIDTLISNGQIIFTSGSTPTFVNILDVYGQIIFNNSTATVSNQINFSQNNYPEQFVLNQGSTVNVNGNADIVISNVQINDQSTLVISNLNADISGVTGNGGIISYVIDSQELSNNNITGIQSNAVDIHLTGKVMLFISNSNGGTIIEVPPANGANQNKLVTFEQTNSFISISTQASEIAINDNSALTLYGTGSGIYGGNLNVLGYLTLNQIKVNLDTIVVSDGEAELIINGTEIYGSVQVVAGQVTSYGESSISQDLEINQNGAVSFNSQSGLLTVGQNCDLFGTLYMDSYIVPDSPPQLIVNGTLQFNQDSSLLLDFFSIPLRGQVYNLIKYLGQVSGTISHVTIMLNGELFTSIKPSVQNVLSNRISLIFEGSTKVHKTLPGWAAFLIIVAVVGTVAGIFYVFYRYKKREGYLPLN